MSIIAIFLLFSMLAVTYFDVTRFIIPNWLVGGLLAFYPIALWLSPAVVDWQMALVAMLIMFAVGYVVFAMKWMGGGDVKLIIVLALWVGLDKLPIFLITFSLLGGLLAVMLLVLRKLMPHISSKGNQLPRILRDKEPVPYGVAIAGAFFWMIMMGEVVLANP